MNITLLPQYLIETLGWTLIHWLWQGLAVVVILAVLLKAFAKISSSKRYLVGCAGLAAMMVMPMLTFKVLSSRWERPIKVAAVEVKQADVGQLGTIEMPVVENAAPAVEEAVAPVIEISFAERVSSAIEAKAEFIVYGWLIGVFGFCLWHLGGWRQLQKLRKTMVKPVGEKLVSKMNKLADAVGVKRVVSLMESALVAGPVVVGWLKPMILLPASALTGLNPEQLEAILAHELAHIRRCDYLVNIIQTAVEIVGFYNPAIWWVSAKIRQERENCCDDVAVALTGDKVNYVRALTTMEEVRSGYKLAVAGSGGSLFDRAKRLLTKDRDISGEKSLLTAAVAVLLLAMIAIPAGFAMSSKADNKTGSISKSANSDYKVTLDNGVSIKLVGVCDYPQDGPRSWRPDGTEPEKKLYVKRKRDYSGGKYGFILKVDGPDDLSFAWNKIEGSKSWWGSCTVLDSSSIEVEGYQAAVIKKYDGKEAETNIRVGIATGAWNKVVSHDGKSMYMTEGIAFATAYESNGAVRIVVTDGLENEVVQRIIAIDENGNIHTCKGSSGSVSNQNLRQTTANFPGLNLKQIKEFQFQTRPYEWVEFKNVSLKPDNKTDVRDETNVKVSVTTGKWTTQSKIDKGTQGYISDDVYFTGGYIDENGRSTDTVYHKFFYKDVRILAVDSNGTEHEPTKVTLGRQDEFAQIDASFENLVAKEVKSFYFQTRPLERVEVEDVSLKADGEAVNRVEGYVTDLAGVAVVGAELRRFLPIDADRDKNLQLFSHDWRWSGKNVLVTNGQGRFAFEVSGDESFGLYVKADGFARRLMVNQNFSKDAEKLKSIILQPESKILGRVLKDGKGVANATVSVALFSKRLREMLSSPFPNMLVYTDNDGYYSIAGLPAGEISIFAELEAHRNTIQKKIELEQGSEVELNFGDEVGFVLTGTVTMDGKSIEAASVRAMKPKGVFLKHVRTDSSGKFKITGIAAGNYKIITDYFTGLDPNTFRRSNGEQFVDFKDVSVDGDLTVDIDLSKQKKSGEKVLNQNVALFKRKLDQLVTVDIDESSDGSGLTVQYAVIAICKAAGVSYNWDKSAKLADPQRRKFIDPLNLKIRVAGQAIMDVVSQAGLAYGVDVSGVYLYRPEKVSDIKPGDFKLRFDSKKAVYNLVVSINNDSDAMMPKFKLRYYRGDPAENNDETGNPHSGWHNAGPIEPGKQWNERTRGFGLPDGEYEFTVVLDYDNKIAETDENNTASIKVVIKDGKIVSQLQSKVDSGLQVLATGRVIKVPASLAEVKKIVELAKNAGVIEQDELKDFLKFTQRTHGSILLAMPKVTVIDGESANIRSQNDGTGTYVELQIKNTVGADKKTITSDLSLLFDSGDEKVKEISKKATVESGQVILLAGETVFDDGSVLLLFVTVEVVEDANGETGIVGVEKIKEEPLILLGMQLVDITPEVKTKYQLSDESPVFGVLILDPGFRYQRLDIGELKRGNYFWMVGDKKIHNIREMIIEMLRINAKGKPTKGGSITEGHEGFVRVVYCYGNGMKKTNTQYIKLTKDDSAELRKAGETLGIAKDKLYYGDDEKIEKRKESMERLRKLGLSFMMYANYHAGEYPDGLEQVRPYVDDEDVLKWLIDNVEYVAKGKKITILPYEMVAYDKTMLAEGAGGSNVLFNDTHVEFKKKDFFEKHEIGSGQIIEDGLVDTASKTQSVIVQKKSYVALEAFRLRMEGHVDKARDVLDTALSRNAKDSLSWFESSRLYFYMCDFDKACDAINKAVGLEPSNARYQYWVGQTSSYDAIFKFHDPNTVADATNQVRKASKAFEQVLVIDPNFHEARFELINLYLKFSLVSEDDIQKQICKLDRIAPVWAAKAKCLLIGTGNMDKKLQIWEDVVAEYESNADAHIGLGDVYWYAKRNEDALEQFNLAFNLEPQRKEILFDIARCYQGMKKYNLQVECYQKYLDSEPSPPVPMRMKALRYLAKTERVLGDISHAKFLENQANEMDPRYGKRGAIVNPIQDFFIAP